MGQFLSNLLEHDSGAGGANSSATTVVKAHHVLQEEHYFCYGDGAHIVPWHMLWFWAAVLAYLFYGLAIVCDEYFVLSLEVIGKAMQLSESVQGASLMAAGSSFPEFLTAVMGALIFSTDGGDDDNPGPTTNVGSAVFNTCIIVGASVLFDAESWRCGPDSGRKVRLFPLVRDVGFFCIATVVTYVFYVVVSPGLIEWWEGLAMACGWPFYLCVLYTSDRFEQRIMGRVARLRKLADDVDEDEHGIEFATIAAHAARTVDSAVGGANPDAIAAATERGARDAPGPNAGCGGTPSLARSGSESDGDSDGADGSGKAHLNGESAKRRRQRQRGRRMSIGLRQLGILASGRNAAGTPPRSERERSEGPLADPSTAVALTLGSMSDEDESPRDSPPPAAHRAAHRVRTSDRSSASGSASRGSGGDHDEAERRARVSVLTALAGGAPPVEGGGLALRVGNDADDGFAPLRRRARRVRRAYELAKAEDRLEAAVAMRHEMLTLEARFAIAQRARQRDLTEVQRRRPCLRCVRGFLGHAKTLFFLLGLPFHVLFFLTIPRPRTRGGCTCRRVIRGRRRFESAESVFPQEYHDDAGRRSSDDFGDGDGAHSGDGDGGGVEPEHLHHNLKHPLFRCMDWRVATLLSFVASIAWLGVLTFFIVDIAEDVMLCQGYGAAWTGLTVLAVGSSLPDCLSSVVVAREGKMDMAISNAFGSNIFDIFFCLGLPFFLQAVRTGEPVNVGDVEIFSWLTVGTFVCVAVFNLSFAVTCLTTRLMHSIVLVATYALFLGAFYYAFVHGHEDKSYGKLNLGDQ
jgi:Ca2+/Na+ antiporter